LGVRPTAHLRGLRHGAPCFRVAARERGAQPGKRVEQVLARHPVLLLVVANDQAGRRDEREERRFRDAQILHLVARLLQRLSRCVRWDLPRVGGRQELRELGGTEWKAVPHLLHVLARERRERVHVLLGEGRALLARARAPERERERERARGECSQT
jgi:hypothetical protein